MSGARLDRKIIVQQFTAIKNALGGEDKTWSEYVQAWASVTPATDGERWRADAIGATITDRFVIKWSATASKISVKHRINYAGKFYDINGVKELGRRHRLEITATAVSK